jgi:hypothetical protein
MTHPPDGVDPRVIRAKADAAEIHDAEQQIQDLRTYSTRMTLATIGAALLSLAGLFSPDRALALGLWAGAVIGILAALLFIRPKRRGKRTT